MSNTDNIIPLKDELPSSFADRLGVFYSSRVSDTHKKKLGQFFTPVEIARFMANLSNSKKSRISILDPGCGTATLSCAMAETLLKNNPRLSEIKLVAYETDSDLIALAEHSLSYLRKWLAKSKVRINYVLIKTDFILDNADTLENQNREKIRYDIAISNPPYFKLQKSDERASAVNLVVHGQPNIYSIFLYLAATLLENGGQVIFIVPRSFTSGFYFKLFREKFFSQIQLNHIHLFGSRRDAFSRYEVLQENVIISGKLRGQNGHRSRLAVSFSEGLKDLQHTRATEFYSDELLDMNSRQKILYLPLNENEAEIIRLFRSWKGNLNKYNIQVSTGPVVAFRAKKYICTQPQNAISFAPLFWLHNIYKMKISWPLNKDGKGEYIQIGTPSVSLLIPNKNYIFLRRFSAKDDRSRLIAAPYYSNASDSDFIGVENHLNYIYRPNGHLEKNEMLGLAALLNSTLFDAYFRTFNGNINVSATEIRGIPLPPIETIKGIGDALLFKSAFTQKEIDEVVNHFLTREKMEFVSYG